MADKQPPRYVIGYEDSQRYRALLARHEGEHDAIDPADIWQTEEAQTLVGAISMARARERVHRVMVTVYERIGMVARHLYPEYPAIVDWDWDEKRAVGEVQDGKWMRYDAQERAGR